MAIRLGIDPRKSEQRVRGSVELPHGLGRQVRVAVFADGEQAEAAKKAGADLVGLKIWPNRSPPARWISTSRWRHRVPCRWSVASEPCSARAA